MIEAGLTLKCLGSIESARWRIGAVHKNILLFDFESTSGGYVILIILTSTSECFTYRHMKAYPTNVLAHWANHVVTIFFFITITRTSNQIGAIFIGFTSTVQFN